MMEAENKVLVSRDHSQSRQNFLNNINAPKVRDAISELDDGPYHYPQIFPRTSGLGAAKQARKKVKLLNGVNPVLNEMLLTGEEVRFISRGTYCHIGEQFLLGWLSFLINRTIFVFTNYRIILMNSNFKDVPAEMKWQIPYSEIKKFSSGSIFSTITFKLKDGKRLSFSGVPRHSRKQLKILIREMKARCEAEHFDFPHYRSLDHLCPQCFQPVPKKQFTCDHCREVFISPFKPTLMSFFVPCLGDFYLGHFAIGVLELIGLTFTWFFMGSLLFSGEAELALSAGFILFIFHGFDAMLTHHMASKGLISLGHTWGQKGKLVFSILAVFSIALIFTTFSAFRIMEEYQYPSDEISIWFDDLDGVSFSPSELEKISKQVSGLNADEISQMGRLYEDGQEGLTQDWKTALALYRIAAEKGNQIAQNNLGVMYLEGRGMPSRNYAKALHWLGISAGKGEPTAQLNLGYMFQNGLGVGQDHKQAVELYRSASAQGDADAQNSLGVMFLDGLGVLQSDAAAIALFKQAVAQNHATAKTNLGFMYLQGLGTEKKPEEALHLFLEASTQGSARATTLLGTMHQEGWGIQQDFRKAVEFFEKAADLGDAVGQYYLASLLMQGMGVSQDFEKARFWFEKAAEQGDQDAIRALAEMDSQEKPKGMYQWIDENGNLNMTSYPPPRNAKILKRPQ